MLLGDSRAMLATLEAESVNCIVTSPPYWGLRKYSGEQETDWADGWHGALGLEPTADMFIAHLMEVMAALWRVLRKDGVCWVNLDDTRTGSWGNMGSRKGQQRERNAVRYERHAWDDNVSRPPMSHVGPGVKPKDMALIPERFILAAQAHGWYVRSKIVWALPNPMPESCKDRPSDSFQMVYMLTKSERYWYDMEAVRESGVYPAGETRLAGNHKSLGAGSRTTAGLHDKDWVGIGERNLRSVWTFPTRSQGVFRVNGKSIAHFTAFPPELPRRAILASCPPYVCPACRAPWVRGREKTGYVNKREPAHVPGHCPTKVDSTGWAPTSRATDVWSPTCAGPQPEKEFCPPGTVLDPFAGSGTTLLAAKALGRNAVGIDCSADYVALARHRRERQGAPLFPATEETLD